jgi:hypothetical protein
MQSTEGGIIYSHRAFELPNIQPPMAFQRAVAMGLASYCTYISDSPLEATALQCVGPLCHVGVPAVSRRRP